MNRYLEKVAFDLTEYWDNLSGKNHNRANWKREAKAYVKAHPHESMGNLERAANLARKKMINTRIITGAGAAGIAGVGMVGLHAYSKHRENQILNQIAQEYQIKQAGYKDVVGHLENGLGAVARPIGNVLKAVGDTSGKALGGPMRTWKTNAGLEHATKLNFKDPDAVKTALGYVGKDKRLTGQALDDFVGKHMDAYHTTVKDQTNARHILGGIGITTGGAYLLGRKHGGEQSNSYTTGYY